MKKREVVGGVGGGDEEECKPGVPFYRRAEAVGVVERERCLRHVATRG